MLEVMSWGGGGEIIIFFVELVFFIMLICSYCIYDSLRDHEWKYFAVKILSCSILMTSALKEWAGKNVNSSFVESKVNGERRYRQKNTYEQGLSFFQKFPFAQCFWFMKNILLCFELYLVLWICCIVNTHICPNLVHLF